MMTVSKLIILSLFGLLVSAKALTLGPDVLLKDDSGSEAVGYAVDAFRQDIQRTFGVPNGSAPISFNFLIDPEWDAFDRFRTEIGSEGITITGSDELGLIHGIYTFSEEVLGIDPCIYFTGILPEQMKSLELDEGTTESKSYTFTHRAMFVNDEDLIIGFQMAKQSHGMNPEFMAQLYETMLRLKMTGVIPSTLLLSDEPHLIQASDMGLYIAQHHAEPLGSVPLYWPKNIPYSWSTHKEHFIKFWSDAIKRQKGKNVIWTLNFRGLLDRAFWDDDPTMSRDSSREDKARIVNEVIQTQYELVKEITGNEKPLLNGYLWGELSGLYASGLIKFPADTMLLFADNGAGLVYDSKWEMAEKCTLGKGIYQHVSYHNRKTHMRINSIHPDLFQEQMAKAVEVGATDMMVLNVGNFKEKIFGIRQMVSYMTDFDAHAKEANGDWYFDWYAKEVLKTDAPAVADSYRSFFASQFVLHDPVKKPGDEYYFYYVERMLNMAYAGILDRWFLGDLLGQNGKAKLKNGAEADELFGEIYKIVEPKFEESERRWKVSLERAYDCRRYLSGNALEFYNVDLVYPTLKMYHLTAMASHFTESIKQYKLQEFRKARLAADQALRHAKEALVAEQKIESAGWGQFEDWYVHDETARTWHIEKLLKNYIAHLEDLTYFNEDYRWRNPKSPGLEYKYQPGFESAYRDELIWMRNGD